MYYIVREIDSKIFGGIPSSEKFSTAGKGDIFSVNMGTD